MHTALVIVTLVAQLPSADVSPAASGDDGGFHGEPVPGLFEPDAGAPAPLPALTPADLPPFPPPPFVEAPDAPTAGAQPRFVKGELSSFLGADRVITKNNWIGAAGGIDQVDTTFFLRVEPQVDLRFLDAQLAIGLGVPLRFEIADLEHGFDQQWQLRKQDWDQAADFARVLKYVTYGRKEEKLYINAGQRYPTSIGHGALVRRYAPNVDLDVTRVSLGVDAYNDYAGFELLTNDVLAWNLLAGLAFVKPLAFIDTTVTRSFSVGVSAAADLAAPRALTIDTVNQQRQVRDHRLVADTTQVALAGIDAEVKVLKTKNADIKPYFDYSFLNGGDAGYTFGALGRFNLGDDTVHALRTVFELRWLGARYVPSYFDTFYEVDRYIASIDPAGPTGGLIPFRTKYQDVMAGRPQRVGYYVEQSYGIRGNVGLTFALEGQTALPEKNFVAHLEFQALSFINFFGSYYKRGFSDFSTLTRLDEQSIVFAGARLRLLPVLAINGRAFKTFRLNEDQQRYVNGYGWAVDVEIGYEFAPSVGPKEGETSGR